MVGKGCPGVNRFVFRYTAIPRTREECRYLRPDTGTVWSADGVVTNLVDPPAGTSQQYVPWPCVPVDTGSGGTSGSGVGRHGAVCNGIISLFVFRGGHAK